MGCAASSSTGTSSSPEGKVNLDKHPNDFTLENLEFEKIAIPEFDDLFTKASGVVDTLVEWNNEINENITEIQHAVADIAGAFKVHIVSGKDGDIITIELSKADGGAVAPEDIALLIVKPSAAAADTELAEALAALNSKYPSGVKVADGVVACEQFAKEAEALNKAIGTFKTETGFSMKLTVKAAASAGTVTPYISLTKSHYVDPDDAKPKQLPVTLFDVYGKVSGPAIYTAWSGVLVQSKALAKVNKDAGGDFGAKAGKVKVEKVPEDAAKAKALAKAVSALNSQVFKLQLAALHINGEISLVRATVYIVESLIQKVKKMAEGIQDPIKLVPKIKVNEDFSFDFDFEVEVKIPGFKPFPECLPTAAKRAYELVLKLKDTIMKIVAEMPEMQNKVQELINTAKDFVEKAPEAATAAGLDMMSAMKAAKNCAVNVKVLGGLDKYVTGTTSSVQRVATELGKCVSEIDIAVKALV